MQARLGTTIAAYSILAIAGAGAFMLPSDLALESAQAGWNVRDTALDEVRMYTIDIETGELLRYEHAHDGFTVIGPVVNEDGETLVGMQSLAWIPVGPSRGLYGATPAGAMSSPLCRIDVATARAVAVPVETSLDAGLDDLLALTSVYDRDRAEWGIQATTRSTRRLVRIDPAHGTWTPLMNLTTHCTGIARGADGIMYAVSRRDLYVLDVESGAQTHVATLNGVDESLVGLGFAFGERSAAIDVDGLPSAFAANGLLFGIGQYRGGLYMIDPRSGRAVDRSSAISGVDARGVVCFTRRTDPNPSF